MERKSSSLTRWLNVIWLLASQTTGLAMVFAPMMVLIGFSGLGKQDADPTMFNILLLMGYMMPLVFIGLAIWAWVSFFKHKDAKAALLALASLLPGVIILFGMKLYAP